MSNLYELKNLTLTITALLEPTQPWFDSKDETVSVSVPLPFQIFCNVSGVPKPTIKWMKVNKIKCHSINVNANYKFYWTELETICTVGY